MSTWGQRWRKRSCKRGSRDRLGRVGGGNEAPPLLTVCADKDKAWLQKEGKKESKRKDEKEKKPAKTSAFSLLDAPRGLIRVRIRTHFFLFFLHSLSRAARCCGSASSCRLFHHWACGYGRSVLTQRRGQEVASGIFRGVRTRLPDWPRQRRYTCITTEIGLQLIIVLVVD